ncbi:MAG: Bax inhibitor-1 family protein [Flavobacteriales bacterium]
MRNSSYNTNISGMMSATDVRAFISKVYSYMTSALFISALTAWYFADSGLLIKILTAAPFMQWVIILAPLAAVFAMSLGFNKFSQTTLLGLFFGYAFLMGVSFSAIFLVFSLGTIGKVFFITAALFGVMAVLGYTTKTDLTAMGGILMMALIGMIIAGLVNMFLQSDAMDYVLSCIGVLVFTGLTAYDMQRIKRIGEGVEFGTASASKLALMGALSLYLNFVNLFMMLLRVFGGRNE